MGEVTQGELLVLDLNRREECKFIGGFGEIFFQREHEAEDRLRVSCSMRNVLSCLHCGQDLNGLRGRFINFVVHEYVVAL